MGLTIHWELVFGGDMEAALAKVTQMRQKAMDMSFVEVSEVAHFVGAECDYQQHRSNGPKHDEDDAWVWLLIQAQGHDGVRIATDGRRLRKNEKSQDGCVWISPKPVEVIAFRTWPGEGCEGANFGLARHETSVWHNGKEYKVGKGGWSWGSFCKTQYANEHGVMNFVRCHTLVVAMLDYAKELEILKEVSDEGGYWEKRDLKALVEEVGRWDKFVAGFSEMLGAAVGKENLVSEIANHPQYEKLKELGMQHLNERGIAQLRELFEAVKQKAKEAEK